MFSHIARCLDLQEKHIVEAIVSGDSTRALLAHLASVSAPETGCAKVLLLFARMATTACTWLDGDLVIELVARDDATVAEAAIDLGGGLRERAVPTLILRAPLTEFARAIHRAPHMIAPLSIRAKSPQRIVLTATAVVRRTSIPPAPFEISSDSLFVRVPTAALPQEEAPAQSPPSSDVDEGWDD